MTVTRACAKCGTVLPHTKENFPNLKSRCRPCTYAYERERRQRIAETDPARHQDQLKKSAEWRRKKVEEDPEYARRIVRKSRERKKAGQPKTVRVLSDDPKNVAHRAARERWAQRDPVGFRAAVERGHARYRAAQRANPDYPFTSRTQNALHRSRTFGCTEHFTVDELKAVYAAQGGLCAYCGAAHGDDFQVEHKQPLERGGRNDVGNICISCGSCNRRKALMNEAEFRARLARLGEATPLPS